VFVDCKTDVFFNSLSLAFPYIGYKANLWWLDPAGAGVLSLYIIYDWASTCLENVTRLTGIGVDDEMLKKIIFMAWRFSPIVDGYKVSSYSFELRFQQYLISEFQSINAYHSGEGVWVEIDILLDEKTSLEHAHDVAETMQYCLEGLPDVDRAFVSVDYTTTGPRGHVDGA